MTITGDHAHLVAEPGVRQSRLLPIPPDLLARGGRPFDPPPGRRRLVEQGPVARIELLNGASAWMVTGFDEARAVLSDPRFSADTYRHISELHLLPEEVHRLKATGHRGCPIDSRPRDDGMFIFMDPPEHTRLRRLLTGQFTVRRLRRLEDRIRAIAVERLDAMRAAGNSADLVTAFALPLPTLVICELLGVDYADRAYFGERTATFMSLESTDEVRAQAQRDIAAFIHRLVIAKRDAPTDDLLSGAIHGDITPPLTDAELVDIGLTLLVGGQESTANMLALSMFLLFQHPEQLAAVRRDPALLDAGIEELLRFLSIVHFGPWRVATEDLPLGEVTIAAGDTVVLSLPNANRDPSRWRSAPERLDLTRPRVSHLAFGHGVHQCLGQQLARVELRAGLAELITGFPGLRLAVEPDEVPLCTDLLTFGVHSLPVMWD